MTPKSTPKIQAADGLGWKDEPLKMRKPQARKTVETFGKAQDWYTVTVETHEKLDSFNGYNFEYAKLTVRSGSRILGVAEATAAPVSVEDWIKKSVESIVSSIKYQIDTTVFGY